MPDVGIWKEIIYQLTGVHLLRVFGKPDRGILLNSSDSSGRLNFLSLTARNSVVIGDRLETDVRLGIHAGISTVLALSGATTEMTFQENFITLTFVVNSVVDLLY